MIAANSQVLISGVSPMSLILGVSLSKAGIAVVIIDENSALKLEEENLKLNDFEADFLSFLGFNLKKEENHLRILTSEIEKQAFQLLALQLCPVFWDTKVKLPSEKGTVFLTHNGKETNHQTHILIQKEELHICKNFGGNLKNISLYFWKIEGYFKGTLDVLTLKSHDLEKQLVAQYFNEDAKSKNFIERFFHRRLNALKTHFQLKESKLNLHLSQFRKIEAGELLPNFKVFDEKLKKETSFYDWCKFGTYNLIMMGQMEKFNLTNNANWIKSNYNLNLFYLPPSEKNQAIFDAFEIFEGEKKTVIVRPDRYIGLINDRVDLEIIDNYLCTVFHMKPLPKAFAAKALHQTNFENYP